MTEQESKVGDLVEFKDGGSFVFSNFGALPYYKARIVEINGSIATTQAIGTNCKMSGIPLGMLCKIVDCGERDK